METIMKQMYEKLCHYAAMVMNQFIKRCPKSGRFVGIRHDTTLSRILFPIIALIAIVWLLVRVLPKPSRITYPCQQIAAGIGTSFLIYLFGAAVSVKLIGHIRKYSRTSVFAGLVLGCITLGIMLAMAQSILSAAAVTQILTPPDGPNNPMGVARGIFPGRVVWTQDFDATSWDGKNGDWWEDASNDQKTVNAMLSKSIQALTGCKTDAEAWTKLFTWHNKTNGRGETGYKKGEKIAVKINCNAISKPDSELKDGGYPSPHVMHAIVAQLIGAAGVDGSDIIITDPSRFIPLQIYNKIHSDPTPGFDKVIFEQKKALDLPGYTTALPDENNKIYFTMPDGKKEFMYLAKVYTDATYVINCALIRPHRVFGITSVAKNHFGSVWDVDAKDFKPNKLHAFALWGYPTPNKMGQPHCNPVLLGHKTLNSKTVLYMSDGLYTSINQSGPVKRWSTLNNQWFSSILMSQDPVALESVNMDLISSEKNLTDVNPSFNGNQDNQLQECALADRPLSGTVYDPENDGTPLASLGVHEHWNNAKEMQYSRNLGKDKGIELVRP
jgi:hypothetical protein